MDHPTRTNLFPQIDVVKQFGADWFQSFLKTSLNSFSESHEFLKVDFYKDGKTFHYELEKLKQLSDPKLLPCSLRLTNIQLLSPEVLKMCQLLEKQFGKLFTCNLYYTPGPERNCFDFHVDHQLTYVCQIMGTKDWIFPIENQKCMTYLEDKNFHAEMVRHHEYTHELLNPGEHLQVPFGMVHKVEIKSIEPSLHFTFGSFEQTREMAIQNVISLALEESGLTHEIKKGLNKEEILKVVTDFQKAVASVDAENFAKEFEGKILSEEFRIAKLGRPYKKDPSSNQD